jgi:ankyrin repeat protein
MTQPKAENNKKNQRLFSAVSAQNVDLIRDAISNGANINARDTFGFSPLFQALLQSNVESVGCLAELGADMRQVSEDHMFPIAFAAALGNLPALRTLAALCADFESPASHQKNALEIAVDAGKDETVRFLINHGADIECPSESGETLLMRVCVMRKPEIAALLIDAGANLHAIDQASNTVIDYALASRNFTVFRRLAQTSTINEIATAISRLRKQQAFVSLDPLDTEIDTTPALRSNQKTILQARALLIVKKASSFARTMCGRGRSKSASDIDKKQAILLNHLKNGEIQQASDWLSNSPDGHRIAGITVEGAPLVFLVYKTIEELRTKNPDIKLSDATWSSELAVLIVKLIRLGEDQKARNPRNGRTILHEACAAGHDVLIGGLLHEKVSPQPQSVNLSDNDLNRPLHLAVQSRCFGAIELLAKAGADINAVNRAGMTPLHMAAINGDSACASILIARGANIYLPTRDGVSMLSLLDPKKPNFREFLALIQARETIKSAMTIFSGRNPMATAAKSLAGKIQQKN